MKALYVNGIGVLGPGLGGWRESAAILKGTRVYRYEPLPTLTANLLPANERRRTTQVIKLVLNVAQEAMAPADVEVQRVYSVFASSGGDYEVMDKICMALTLAEKPVSPIHFHNSVHNAPAGYWTIAATCSMPSLSLSAYDHSFSAGLLEAATQVLVERASVLLVAYDYPSTFPLAEKRRLYAPFATALLLSPARTTQSQAKLMVNLTSQDTEDRLDEAPLERLRTGNPAARSLPLLQAIARGSAHRVILPYLANRQLIVEAAP